MLSPGQHIDRYVIEALIGSGGTAVVYRVRHRQLGTIHALKVLSLTSAAIRNRLMLEGQVQASLRHLNVVAVTDILEVEGAPGLLLEHIEGPTLEEALRNYQITLADAELLFLGILSGVRHAHTHGLVHRDLKPANVLLATTPEGFVPKVTDFGLAKVVHGDAENTGSTRAGTAMGTPHYMAPEQIRDARNVDQRADIFSLGCILYELCTGERAFPGDEALAVYNSVVSGEYESASELMPDLPVRFEQAIGGCLITDPKRRIPDCATLLAVLRGERMWEVPPQKGRAEPTDELPRLRTEELLKNAPPLLLAARGPDGMTPPPAPERERTPVSYRRDGPLAVFGTDPGALAHEKTEESGPRPIPASVLATSLGSDDTMETDRRRSSLPLMVVAAVALVGFVAVAGALLFLAASVLATGPNDAVAGGDGATSDVASPVVEPSETASVAAVGAADAAPVPVGTTQQGPNESATVTPAATNESGHRKATVPVPESRGSSETASTVESNQSTVAPAPTTPALATVKILSTPPTATVRIDGHDRAPTPLKVELPVGMHQIEIQSGDQSGRFTIEVAPGAENKWCFAFANAQVHSGSCPR